MDIARLRLSNQLLTVTSCAKASDVVAALGAVQAQDYAGAKWGLAQRTRGVSDADIERELDAGTIIRTHVLRPTWHFVSPHDIRWMLALTAPRVNAAMAVYDRRLELTSAVYRRTNAVIAKALAGGRHLTRAELRPHLERARVGAITVQRLGHIMMRAELDGVVCSGPRRGKQSTYGLFDERVPAAPAWERDQSLDELARRYFATRGPATAQDFAWWSGLVMADARRAIEIVGRALSQTMIDGRTYWFTERSAPKATPTAHLLPNYDEYFIGFRDRSAIGQRLGSVESVTGWNALLAHVVVIDGQLVGTWRRTFERKRVALRFGSMARLTRPERERVAAAAERFGTFLGAPVALHGLQ